MNGPFEGISNKNKNNLFTLLAVHVYTFEENQNILSTIKNDNVVGIIDEGSAKIIRTDYDGNRVIIEQLNKDSVFGTTISSITSNEYEIIAKEKTTIIIIDYDRLVDRNNISYSYYNIFLQNMFCILNKEMQERNERIRILTKKTIRNKLLEYFKLLQTDHHSRYIYIPFSFTSLSEYLAVDRCAMTRELKYLKEEGFIETKGKRITILY